MSGQNLSLSKIGQIASSVADIKRSIAFYRDTLGMKLLFSFETMAFFDCEGVRLMLALPETPGTKVSSLVYFTVPEIQDAFETLKTRGVNFNGQPHVVHRDEAYDLWMAFFRDPDENQLALMSEVPKR